METQWDMEMVLHPSRIPAGTVHPARHYVTKQRNRVKVGRVTIGRTAIKTIKQPVYLRQGYGIFLRKYQSPRREHYGPAEPERLQYYTSQCQDYSGHLTRALYTPGVVMTTRSITAHQLDPQFEQMRRAVAATPTFSPKQREAIQAELEKRRDLQSIVKRNPDSARLLLPRLTSEVCFVDQEGRKTPPPFFIPPEPLPGPEYSLGVESVASSFFFTDQPLLRRPDMPELRLCHPNFSSSSSSSTSSTAKEGEREQETEIEQPRVRLCPLPEFMPRVFRSPSSIGHPPLRVPVTSARLQRGLVDLKDMFPYHAEKGLLAEIPFYQKHFPLLLTRNAEVDLDTFNSLNPTRMLPPELVQRVHSLTQKVARQKELTQEGRSDDSDQEDDGSTCMDDKVFDPLSYLFNSEVYQDVKQLSKANKL